jgi:hypothetical protein
MEVWNLAGVSKIKAREKWRNEVGFRVSQLIEDDQQGSRVGMGMGQLRLGLLSMAKFKGELQERRYIQKNLGTKTRSTKTWIPKSRSIWCRTRSKILLPRGPAN